MRDRNGDAGDTRAGFVDGAGIRPASARLAKLDRDAFCLCSLTKMPDKTRVG